jgi:stage V sporulation protein B
MKQEKSKFNVILGGTLSLTLSTIIVKILGLIYKIPLATILGDEGMGYFNSGYTVYSFFYLLCTAGVPKSVMILVSKPEPRRIIEGQMK